MAERESRSEVASVRALEARLRGLHAAVAESAGEARRLTQEEHQWAQRRYKAAHAPRADLGASPDEAVDRAASRAAAEVAPAVRRLVERLAPGLAGLPPSDPGWRSREFVGAGGSTFVRIGGEATDLPFVAPLLNTVGWAVRAERAGSAYRLLQTVALRQVATAEPFRVRVDAFDPQLSGAMGLLGGVTASQPQLVSKPLHTASELHALLASLIEVSSERGGRLSQLGHERFEDLLREGSQVTDAYRLVLLFDYPAGVDAHAQRDLVRLASTAGRRGLCFVVHHDPSVSPEHGVDPRELTGRLDVVTIDSEDVIEHDLLPGVAVSLDPAFDADTASAVCDLVAELAEQAALPTIDFASTLPDRAQWWRPARDELSTVVGFRDRTPSQVRLRSSNPALPHMLVAGAVGQGKSNLLLVLIHGLAAHYAPTDLEMYLLDFKHGVEFAAMGPGRDREHWLPHVRVLGVHSDRDFGLAVLRHLTEELARRSELFKDRGVADISEFPAGEDRPPRVLAVLDEFQVLLEEGEDQADEAARLLERLARLGRAYGVHLVLSTQTIEGVGRLATRRDSIFGQVPYRIALKTTPSDSQAILRQGNTAAADLQFRGEAILNQNFGSPDDNQRILVSYADRDALDELRRELHAKADAMDLANPPRVFHLGESARLADLELDAASPTRSVHAWAGMPIAVSEQPATLEVRPEPGAGVLLLGDGPADAIGVLTGLTVSTAAQAAGQRPRYLVLDAVSGDESTAEGKAALLEALTMLGSEAEVVDDADAIRERLIVLRDAIKQREIDRPLYVLGVGMHAVPGMKTHLEGRFESAADAFAEVLQEGPAAGVITFGWWNRLHVCTDQLGYQRANIAAHIFLRHPLDGVRSVCGPLTRWASEPHRALVWDGLNPEPTTVVPFAPLRVDEVQQLLRGAVR